MNQPRPETGLRGGQWRPQLDALRALAVADTLLVHFGDGRLISLVPVLGTIGVNLFFVLSGFLITRILLRCKALVEQDQASSRQVLARFYARRALRILPLYYAAVAFLTAHHSSGTREALPWNLFYLTNVFLARAGSWHFVFGPYWSLAVEEQFYLVWPLLVLLLPRRWLWAPVGLLTVGLPVLHQWVGPINPVANVLFRYDELGWGVLLALAWSGLAEPDRRGLARRLLCAALLLQVARRPLAHVLHVNLYPLDRMGTQILLVWLVDGAARGFGGPLGRLLSWKPLLYLGRISYGVYVLHSVAADLCDTAGLPLAWWKVLVTVIGASLSWSFFEQPINNLKRLVPYTGLVQA